MKKSVIEIFLSWVSIDPVKEIVRIITKGVMVTKVEGKIPNNNDILREEDRSINLN